MNLNIFFIFIYLLDKFCNSLDFPFIDDIPIENYNHADHREDEIDLELLPIRQGRSSAYDDDDPKEYFFRNMRTFENLFDSKNNKNFGPYQNIPRPPLQQNLFGRKKRSTTNSAENSHQHKSSLSSIEENLGESSLEIIPLDTTITNLTEKEDKAETRVLITENQKEINNSNISINDFIRFRRASRKEREQEAIIKPLASEKLLMKVPDAIVNRETRASIKDNWANKEAENDKMSFADGGGDNIPSPTVNHHHNLRSPRVDFVTQHHFTDNRLAPSELRNYEREPRTHHHLLNYIDMAEERFLPRDAVGREPPAYYYHPQSARRFRSYAPPPSSPIIDRERDYYRDDLYGEYDTPPNYSRDYYYQQSPQRYENYYDRTRINDYNSNNNNNEPSGIVQQKPRKRIIYLANLPDIPKSPPPSPAANAERYRDRYYDGYERFSSNNNNDPYYYRYNNRKSYYPNNNLRYEDVGIRNKAPLYPVKVLTDVNVREVKKNPESRIYSEVGGDRNNRYAYNTPSYRRADG